MLKKVNLAGISLETNEKIIIDALSRQPITRLYSRPNVLDTMRLHQGRPIMREKNIVKIQEISNEL